MKYIITFIGCLSLSFTFAQNINWSSQDQKQNNFIYLNKGFDYGLTVQLGYAYQLNLFNQTLITADISVPMGKDFFDDYKGRLTMHSTIFSLGDFTMSGKIAGIARRHETNLVRINNFGAEMTAILGYYKPKFHIAAEFGFDKAISTHLKHQGLLKENFPEITDGWFVPTGGNFNYGIQASKTIGQRFELSLRLGTTSAEKGGPDALLPVYGVFGLLFRL